MDGNQFCIGLKTQENGLILDFEGGEERALSKRKLLTYKKSLRFSNESPHLPYFGA